jgi:hypothetical protein
MHSGTHISSWFEVKMLKTQVASLEQRKAELLASLDE